MRQIGTEYQEQHLDMMIKLAFDLDDAEEVQRIVDEKEPELTPEEQAFADRILAAVLLKVEHQNKLNRRQSYTKKARQIIPRMIEVVACFVLIVAVATPIALANSAAFRAKVMQLLIQMDNEKGEAYFSFEQNPNASFWIPEGWLGGYFLSYIPDGFQIYEFDPLFTMVEYRNTDGSQFIYSEYDETSELMTGIEDATITPIEINGHTGYIIEGMAEDEKTNTVTVTWSNDTNWFSITGFGISSDLMIQVASNVRKIIK